MRKQTNLMKPDSMKRSLILALIIGLVIGVFRSGSPSPVAAQESAPTDTPTATPTDTPTTTPTDTPTDTPTTTPTDTPTTIPCSDTWEPNDNPGSGPALLNNQALEGVLLHPLGEVDYFLLWGKSGQHYQVTTATSQGVDTRLRIYEPDGTLTGENDDYAPANPASRLTFQAPVEGWFAVAIDSPVPLDWGCASYSVVAVDVEPTPTPTAPATPSPCLDPWEPNDNPGSGPALLNNQALEGGLLHPLGEIDYFLLWGKSGQHYQVTTATGQGVDTRLRIYEPGGTLIGENDDYTPANPASRITFQAAVEGWFAVAVDSPTPLDWECASYSVVAVDVESTPTPTPTATATATPTATPQPTSPPGPAATATPPPTDIPTEKAGDAYEPNYDLATAATIGVGQTLNLNFNPVPPDSGVVDNDFFRFSVKPGDRLRLETLNLSPGIDTNLILYRENEQLIAGNDDCQTGERRSCLEWTADYQGLAYLLVGPVGLTPDAASAGSRAYSLLVKDLNVETPTPASNEYGEPVPWPVTPVSPTPAATATPLSTETPTATPTTVVRVKAFSLAAPTPTPRPLQSLSLAVTIYYDENNNQGADANEGVIGLEIRALDSLSNQILGQAFTDNYGHASLTVAAVDQVRLSVPYLGYNQAVRPPGNESTIRLTPLRLPSLIP